MRRQNGLGEADEGLTATLVTFWARVSLRHRFFLALSKQKHAF